MSPWWAVAAYVVAVFSAGGAMRAFVPDATVLQASLVWLVPAFAAGVTWLVGRRTLAIMLPAPVPRRQLVAHTILGAVAAAALAALTWIGWLLVPAPSSAPVDVLPLWLAAIPLAFALELGWRGTLQPLVEPRLGRMGASLGVGLVWAAWRLELDDGATIVATLVLSLALSVLLGYLGTGAWWQRWITAGVAQAVLSVAIAGADVTGPRALVLAGASVVVAVVWLLMFRSAQRRRAARAEAA